MNKFFKITLLGFFIVGLISCAEKPPAEKPLAQNPQPTQASRQNKEPFSPPPQQEQQQTKRVHFATLNPQFRFSAEIPAAFEIEFIPQITAINIFDPAAVAPNNLEKSQIFIRLFQADRFLTLSTVEILAREETAIGGHAAVRYEIEKKSGVANFANQPSWRSKRHKLIDIRFTKNSPSLFYVFTYNPAFEPSQFEKFIDSIDFDNDREGFAPPVTRSNERITKKPFGIKVTPQDSPVTPERFEGYHTGTDFEALESDGAEIDFFSICGGVIREKKTASGYGGVLVQECLLADEVVTTVYGHIDVATVQKRVGEYLTAGEKIGIFGDGFSAETDGERKHLHLSIHKGRGIDLRGYVGKEEELSAWINVAEDNI